MRRFAITLGLAAALAGATAAPAAAQTISPGSYDWGLVDPKTAHTEPDAEFELTAGAIPLIGDPVLISGDRGQFFALEGSCDGSLSANESCEFRIRVNGGGDPTGVKSAVVGIPAGPTATVRVTFPGGSGKGKKKGCKKKGKKGAAAAKKKKGCKKKGKKRSRV